MAKITYFAAVYGITFNRIKILVWLKHIFDVSFLKIVFLATIVVFHHEKLVQKRRGMTLVPEADASVWRRNCSGATRRHGKNSNSEFLVK